MVAAKGKSAFVHSAAKVRLRARQGLAIYFGMVVLLSAVFQVLLIETGTWLWVIPLMWSPAVASLVARLALGEGFADVSFRVGGRRGWKAIAVAVVFPVVIGLPVYGIAWMTGLARFAPRPAGVAAQLASASPVAAFLVMLAVAATIGTVVGILTAAGEEIGWRGYMLTRLIDAEIPRSSPGQRAGLGSVARPPRPRRWLRRGPFPGRLSPAARGLDHSVRRRVRAVTPADRQYLARDCVAWRVE
jgi:membrane protease YdiL (CAAX protease family)